MSETLLNTPFPTFTLPVSTGGSVTIPEAWKGSWVVLYLYPKDDTPGCTKQACAYRDNLDMFEQYGAIVVGLSADDLESHDAFIQKYNLNFGLLTDADHALTRALGSWRDAEWQGIKYTGLQRDTFMVDPDGIIRRVWRSVNPSTTMSETFDALMELRA